MVVKATTDEQILATRAIMRQLQPNVPLHEYLTTVRRMMQTDGYFLAALQQAGQVRAVAGYRFTEMLYCGRIMYVDDLITGEHSRSKGYGKVSMDWLKT